jgi:hypothetical protein
MYGMGVGGYLKKVMSGMVSELSEGYIAISVKSNLALKKRTYDLIELVYSFSTI